jgi:hypothetical protein
LSGKEHPIGEDQMKTDTLRLKTTVIYLAVLVGVCLVIYVGLRSALIPLTHDEASTFSGFIGDGWWRVFDLDQVSNHFLNTWMEKICFALFGNHEFVLRIPSLIGLILYLTYGFRTISFLQRQLLVIPGFVTFALNPYVLDFFSLARGYGLALGCLVASLFYVRSVWQRGEWT